VHEILTNPAYCGKTYVFTYSYKEAKTIQVATPKPKRKRLIRKPVEEWVEILGATPAIISQETFDLAQAKLEQNRRVPRRSPKRPYLLSGYVLCRYCSRRYRTKSTKPKSGGSVNYVPYYECLGEDRPGLAYQVSKPEVECQSSRRVGLALYSTPFYDE